MFVRVSDFAEVKSWHSIVIEVNTGEVMEHANAALEAARLFEEAGDIGTEMTAMIAHRGQTLRAMLKHANEDSKVLRETRGLNVDVHLDVNSLIGQAFDGLTSIFYGSSVAQLRQHISATDARVAAVASASARSFGAMTRTMKAMGTTLREATGKEAMDVHGLLILESVNVAIDSLRRLDSAAPVLVSGKLPGSLVPLWLAQRLMTEVTDEAEKSGLASPITEAAQVFGLPVMVTSENEQWQILLRIPLFDNKDKADLWEFVPIPIPVPGERHQVPDPEDHLLVPPNGLPMDYETTTLSRVQLGRSCVRIGSLTLCDAIPKSRNGYLPCLGLLWFNSSRATTECPFRDARRADFGPRWVGTNLIFIPQTTTTISTKCPNQDPKTNQVSTFFARQVEAGCVVTSNDWEVRVPMSATKQTTKAVEVIPPKTMDLMKKTIGQGQTLNQVYSVLKLKDLEQDISDINQDLEQMEDLVETLEFLANGTSWDKSDMIATSISGVACLAVVLGLAVAITVWRRIPQPQQPQVQPQARRPFSGPVFVAKASIDPDASGEP